jgi:hypothetical protein
MSNSPTITLDSVVVQSMIEKVVEENILSVIDSLIQDPAWLEKIERMINQSVVQRTVSKIASTDINSIIHQRVDENLVTVHKNLLKNFSSNGIRDQATECQLTVMNDSTVVENQLVAKDLQIIGNTCIKDLTVTGSINTDNRSWNTLAKDIGEKTLAQIETQWRDKLVEQVVELIQAQGIDFDQVTVQGSLLIDGNSLNPTVTQSNIQKLGNLSGLNVKGEAHIYDTMSVVNGRVGINTATPESALSVWDEEISIIIGKHKSKQAFVGTSRDQGLAFGVNRQAQIEIDVDGLTRIKKLQIGLHKISHESQVPGWAGTKGDIVFNSSPGPDRIFAWICLGAHKWQTLKSAE